MTDSEKLAYLIARLEQKATKEPDLNYLSEWERGYEVGQKDYAYHLLEMLTKGM